MSRPKQNALEQVKAKQKAKAAAEHAEAAERRGGGTLRRLDVSNSKKIGIVQRKGRLRANGERKGQRELRRDRERAAAARARARARARADGRPRKPRKPVGFRGLPSRFSRERVAAFSRALAAGAHIQNFLLDKLCVGFVR